LNGAELQPFPGESPAGRGFEVAFEVKSLLAIAEGDGGFDFPRSELGRMRILAGVVILQAGFKVSRESGVETRRVNLRLEDVNVEKRISVGGGKHHVNRNKVVPAALVFRFASSEHTHILHFSGWRAEP